MKTTIVFSIVWVSLHLDPSDGLVVPHTLPQQLARSPTQLSLSSDVDNNKEELQQMQQLMQMRERQRKGLVPRNGRASAA